MKDTSFEVAVTAVVAAAGVALMWRTGGIDLPNVEFSAVGVLIVALVVVALLGVLVGAAARTSRPVSRRQQQKIGSR